MSSEIRSRNGCTNCRRRRRKCSEEQPRCRACVQRNITCEYTQRSVQWAKVATLEPQHTGSVTAPANRDRARYSPSKRQRRPSPVVNELSQSDAEAQEAVASLFSLSSGQFPLIDADDDKPWLVEHSNPTGTLCISPQDPPEADLDEPQRAASIVYIDSSSSSSSSSSHADSVSIDGWEFNDDDLIPGIDPNVFSSPSERIAFAYWFHYLARVLPAHDSAENPYQRLSTLAMASPVLFDTIISLATEYMYCHGHTSPELVAMRHEKALTSLQQALRTASCHGSDSEALGSLSPAQATLAAVLLQIANTVFTGGSGVDTHLTCAAYLLGEQGYINTPTYDFLPRLLVQRFAILDVTTAILRRRRAFLPLDFWLFIPDEAYDRTSPSFREMTGCPQPVLGFYARLSHLAADLRDSGDGCSDTEYAILRKASTLETDMRIYARSRVTFTTTRSSPARHLDTLSQCFYWCAHLILQRVIYRDSPASSRVQQTVRDIVMLIKSMPLGCGPDSSLSFPFYISSREAITEEHQNWVRQRNQELKLVYPGRTRDTLMQVLENIWAVTANVETDSRKSRGEVDAVIEGLERSKDFCLF